MILKTKHALDTREITEDEAWEILDWLLDSLRRHGIDEVILIYGYDWDLGKQTWKDQAVKVDDVPTHIKAAESNDAGSLGYDDLYIKVGASVQIHFCHHEELHLHYDKPDHPLTQELIAYFTETIGPKE
jgi:hypothetical protein